MLGVGMWAWCWCAMCGFWCVGIVVLVLVCCVVGVGVQCVSVVCSCAMCGCWCWCVTLTPPTPLPLTVCRFKTPSCVRSKRLRLYLQHVHMLKAQGRVVGTHGDVWDGHTEKVENNPSLMPPVSRATFHHEENYRGNKQFCQASFTTYRVCTSYILHPTSDIRHSTFFSILLQSAVILKKSQQAMTNRHNKDQANCGVHANLLHFLVISLRTKWSHS